MLPIQVLTRHEAGVNCLAVYGNLVFTGSEDKDIKVITTKTTTDYNFILDYKIYSYKVTDYKVY